MWLLYEIALVIGLIFYFPKAFLRKRLPHRFWSMRLGRYSKRIQTQLEGRSTIWVHAVSVGEILCAKPLLEALKQICPHDLIVLSTVTSSGFEIASKQSKEQVVTIYFPLDIRWCVRQALDFVHPRMLLLVESELWPLVIYLAHLRGIPIAVVNGRISERAFKRYLLVRRFLRGTLNRVDLYLMQSQSDAD